MEPRSLESQSTDAGSTVTVLRVTKLSGVVVCNAADIMQMVHNEMFIISWRDSSQTLGLVSA